MLCLYSTALFTKEFYGTGPCRIGRGGIKILNFQMRNLCKKQIMLCSKAWWYVRKWRLESKSDILFVPSKTYVCHFTEYRIRKMEIFFLSGGFWLFSFSTYPFSRNQLSTLPVHLCNLPLKVLIASNNKLVSLPEEIGHLRHLTELVS